MKKKAKRGTFLRLMGLLIKDRALVILVTLALAAGTGFEVIAPTVIGQITDSLNIGNGLNVDMEKIGTRIFILAGLYLLSAGCLYFARKYLVVISENTAFMLRERLQKKLQRLPLSFLDGQKRGDILARLTSDMVTLTNVMQTNLSTLFTKSLTIIGILVMMFVTNMKLTAIFLIVIPLSYCSIRFITKSTRALFKKQQEAVGELNAYIEEMISANDVMRAFNYEDSSYEKMQEINGKFFRTYVSSRTWSGLITPVTTLLTNLVYIAICVFGGYLSVKGALTLGALQAFLIYASNISSPINTFSMMLNQVQSGLAAADRIFSLLDEEEEKDDAIVTAEETETAAQENRRTGDVAFEHVRFGYVPERELMTDVSFHAKPGQVFAVVGPSGAGKTTLVNLLMRFYEIGGGKILLDGKNTKGMSRNHLRENIGMVLQDTWLFSGTIQDNIAYGKEGAEKEDVIRAARKAQCDTFIQKLPNGYDTWIDNDSGALSTGEKQLLAIARVVISDPGILILDEATSNIDTRTEVLITQAMADMMKGRTAFIIAHRLFTIKNADSILYMENGDIKEVGTHEELMEKRGRYYELYRSSYA